MTPNGTATLQEWPLSDGKKIGRVELDQFGNPYPSDYRSAEKNRHVITCREPMCGGLRYYAGNGSWK